MDKYVTSRDEMLNKFDVIEFQKWLWVNNRTIIEQILFFNDTLMVEKVLMATMCKCCIASLGVSEKVKEKARKELDRLGMSYGIE